MNPLDFLVYTGAVLFLFAGACFANAIEHVGDRWSTVAIGLVQLGGGWFLISSALALQVVKP